MCIKKGPFGGCVESGQSFRVGSEVGEASKEVPFMSSWDLSRLTAAALVVFALCFVYEQLVTGLLNGGGIGGTEDRRAPSLWRRIFGC